MSDEDLKAKYIQEALSKYSRRLSGPTDDTIGSRESEPESGPQPSESLPPESNLVSTIAPLHDPTSRGVKTLHSSEEPSMDPPPTRNLGPSPSVSTLLSNVPQLSGLLGRGFLQAPYPQPFPAPDNERPQMSIVADSATWAEAHNPLDSYLSSSHNTVARGGSDDGGGKPQAQEASPRKPASDRQDETESATPQVEVIAKRRRTYSHESFPEKLRRLLLETEEQGRSDIISFNTAGNAICIHKPEELERDIIPNYFRHQNISSFLRQLRMYGFKRLGSGPDEGSYAHVMFARDRPEECQQIKRAKELEFVLKEGTGGS